MGFLPPAEADPGTLQNRTSDPEEWRRRHHPWGHFFSPQREWLNSLLRRLPWDPGFSRWWVERVSLLQEFQIFSGLREGRPSLWWKMDLPLTLGPRPEREEIPVLEPRGNRRAGKQKMEISLNQAHSAPSEQAGWLRARLRYGPVDLLAFDCEAWLEEIAQLSQSIYRTYFELGVQVPLQANRTQ